MKLTHPRCHYLQHFRVFLNPFSVSENPKHLEFTEFGRDIFFVTVTITLFTDILEDSLGLTVNIHLLALFHHLCISSSNIFISMRLSRRQNTSPFLLSLVCVLGLLNTTFSQTANSNVNPAKINFGLVEELFYQQLNALRTEKGCGKLTKDATLQLAATDQAAYMNSIHALSHTQKTKEKRTPQDRVIFYKGPHDQVGENCIFIFLQQPMKTKYSKTPVTANTYQEVATALFLGWKNSPGHYKNMITPGYDVTGLGFYYSADSSKLYCAEVFGAVPYYPPSDLKSPLNAYNLLPKSAVCDYFQKSDWSTLVPKMRLVRGVDSVYLECEDLPLLKSFFNHPKDGIYFDVVIREQFVCANNNLLNGSAIYDGYMLHPVFFPEILKRNSAVGEKNLFAGICAIPSSLSKYTFELNYGFIKQGAACNYTYPIVVPQKNLAVLQLYPKWLELDNERIPNDTFQGELNFNIPFERGKTQLSDKQKNELIKKLTIYKPFLQQISIKTFSSVEGSTAINIRIQEERASAIKKELNTLGIATADAEIESKENWDEFYKQIENSSFSFLQKLPPEQIKLQLKDRRLLDSIDFILQKTRIAQISVQLLATINDKSDPYLVLGAYKKAVAAGDSLKAFKYQNKLLKALFRYQLHNSDITSVDLPVNKHFLPHWANFIALATFDPELIYTHEMREKILDVKQIDTTYLPLKFNLCIMSLKFMNDYNDTLLKIPELERAMNQVAKMTADSSLIKKMRLNYHIISAYHHYLIHEYDKIDPHLNAIRDYFIKEKLNEREAVKLGLLFNFYGRYTWTIQLLDPFIKKNSEDEDLVFLYVKTAAGTNQQAENNKTWEEQLHKARNMNPARFYNWVDNESFQLLRMPLVKKEFCNIKDEEHN